MIPGLIILLFFFSFLLIQAANILVVALQHISRHSKAGVFALSAIILALGTSFPELFVAVTSALENAPHLSLGLIIGSNIANISLVAGLAAFIVGRVNVHGQFLKRDIWIALIAGILPVILIFDGSLSRVDGLILLTVYAAYATSFFKARFMEIAQEHKKESFWLRLLRKSNILDSSRQKDFGRFFLGIALLLLSADIIVRIAKTLAITAHIPVFVVGLILLAIGTSLPELAFSLRSLGDKEPKMFFGNLLGSTIVNSTLVIGISVVLNPITVTAINGYLVAVVAFVLIYLVFWYFIRSKFRLERWEAGLLFLIYLIFVLVEFW